MNLGQLNVIGSGAYFPIQLTTVLDKDGNPEMVINEKGEEVPKLSWKPLSGDIRLIKQNILAILTFQIGQRFRLELFGSRTWECIEEPNTQAQALLMRDFIRDGIAAWEPRVSAIQTQVERYMDKVHVTLWFQVNGSQSVEELNFDYNPQNNSIDAY